MGPNEGSLDSAGAIPAPPGSTSGFMNPLVDPRGAGMAPPESKEPSFGPKDASGGRLWGQSGRRPANGRPKKSPGISWAFNSPAGWRWDDFPQLRWSKWSPRWSKWIQRGDHLPQRGDHLRKVDSFMNSTVYVKRVLAHHVSTYTLRILSPPSWGEKVYVKYT